jgi:uncharacterized protein (DUF1697 family)
MPDNPVTYIAILRGINVSGKNILRMDALQALFAALGFTHVVTYIQSGNVVFRSTMSDQGMLKNSISEGIMKKFGLKVPVIIRSKKELEQIVAQNPFLPEQDMLLEKMHVTFLSELPEKERIKLTATLKTGSDRFILNGREIYLYCPGGYGNTKLSNAFFESKLKVIATTRNWNTVNKLLEISSTL